MLFPFTYVGRGIKHKESVKRKKNIEKRRLGNRGNTLKIQDIFYNLCL